MAEAAEDTSSSQAAENARGIAAMVVAMACLIGNDSLIKLVSDTLPTGEIIFVRGVIATVLISLVAWHQGAFTNWRALRTPQIPMRIVGEVGATALFLTALFHMPIGTVTAVMQVVPLAVTAGSAIVLGEFVGWRRWMATFAGFIGVLLIIQPGTDNFNSWALLAVAAVFFVALRDLATRTIDRAIPTLLITALTAVSVTCLGLAMGIVETWSMPTATNFTMLTGAAVLLLCAYFLVIVAMRSGEIGAIAPFRYSIVVFALIAGFVIWGEIPDSLAAAGIVFVILAGLYTFMRERMLMRSVRRVSPGTGPSA